ncbi:MAG TPA: lytic transglycosylase domain-containing protein [Afifellaceae bacterium]|nr:lytic transglycosylase domain-containing protein [Afifellaceae bacterium]
MRVLPLATLLSLAPTAAALSQDGAQAAPTGSAEVESAAAAQAAETSGPAAEDDARRARHEAARSICRIIESEAGARRIPAGFFARLIWKESRFNPDAVSPKGAQGIAQFMPGTAAERALLDPLDIPTALAESAAFLRELADAFGNLGLAAAAYNAGPRRVENWIAGRATLPWETLDFVQSITGLTADAWSEAEVEAPDFALDGDRPFEEACIQLAMAGRPRMPDAEPPANWRPWGVQVAAHFSRNVALSVYSRVKSRHAAIVGQEPPMVVRDRAPSRGRAALFAVRVGADTQDEARQICAALKAAGGACLVKKN